MEGLERKFVSPSQALKYGIVYLPEDREREGLINMHCVRENLVLNALGRVSRWGLINTRRERQLIANMIYSFNIKVASYEQEVNQLSGGNKQKVVVGRISSANPRVFLLDEPTRGVDISAKDSILRIIKDNLSEKAGVIITSPGIEDLIKICDRILIVYQGQITGEFLKGNFSEKDIYMAVQGKSQEGDNSSVQEAAE
jgi:ABC-type sugar transport system ATPase subunit